MKRPALVAALALAGALFADICPVIPFVAVTGRPTEADVVRKVQMLKDTGYDQFLIYARSGLQYAYMGEEWLTLSEQFCREAARRGMKVWLYDEYNWPSGTCKGRVPRENDAWRYADLTVHREADGSYRWGRALAPQGWVNVCDREAVARFIELTHAVYEKRLAPWFADRTIQGIFTDEPGHPTAMTYEGRPVLHFRDWRGLEDDYLKRTGRAFRADVEAWLEARRADPRAAADGPAGAVWETYADLMGRQFRSAYFDQLRAWADRMGVLLTGHMISEDSLTGSCRCNGDPLLALKGESLPGMDEIGSRTRASTAEWITLNVVQHAARRNGNGGLVELYALGPNDMTFAKLRQMLWLEALHGVDRYLVSMEVMDHRGLVEKHGYLAPVMEGQSAHAHLRLFLDEASAAARFARKAWKPEVAVRYPQKLAARITHAGAKAPPLHGLLGQLDSRQVAVDLCAEDEPSDARFVLTVQADGVTETRSGRRFPTPREACDWVLANTAPRFRVLERDGSVAGDLVVRNYEDGSAVVLNLQSLTDRALVAVHDGVRTAFRLPARGVVALEPGERVAPVRTENVQRLRESAFALSLAQDNVWRVNFDTNKVGAVTVAAPLKGVRLALRDCALSYAVTDSGRPVDDFEGAPPGEKVFRHDAVPYAFELDGRPLTPAKPCTVLRPDFDPLYRETEPMDLAPGVHTFRIASGEADQNFFLPALFVTGDFSVFNRVLCPRPATSGVSPLSGVGLETYPGALTYAATVAPPDRTGLRLRLATGGLVTSVRWNGKDLGVRAWAPFEWRIPDDNGGRPGRLEITVHPPLVNMFGDVDAPGTKWDIRMWTPPRSYDYAAGLVAPPEWVW